VVERGADRHGSRFALRGRGHCDPERSTSIEGSRRSEYGLMLHHTFQSVSEAFRFIVVIELDTGRMRLGG
jgi:hypothetical protein